MFHSSYLADSSLFYLVHNHNLQHIHNSNVDNLYQENVGVVGVVDISMWLDSSWHFSVRYIATFVILRNKPVIKVDPRKMASVLQHDA